MSSRAPRVTRTGGRCGKLESTLAYLGLVRGNYFPHSSRDMRVPDDYEQVIVADAVAGDQGMRIAARRWSKWMIVRRMGRRTTPPP